MIAEGKIIYLVNSPKDGDTKPNGSKVSGITFKIPQDYDSRLHQ